MYPLKNNHGHLCGLKPALFTLFIMLFLTLAASAQRSTQSNESVDQSMIRPTAEEIKHALSGAEESRNKEARALQLNQEGLTLLTERPTAPPANDMFVNAQLISGTAGAVGGTNVDATIETGEPWR